ncbi:MAG: HAD-IA family hydrolase, partial [Gemmataceae bacterium]
FYEYCQQFAGCEPGRCLFIDDRADNIAAARRHGWRTVQYTDFDALVQELARLGVYNNGFAK